MQKTRSQKNGLLRLFWLALGFVSLTLGTIGIILPVLPTVPFYMLTLFCFMKSSRRLHRWFRSTNLYKKNLQSFVEKRAMPLKAKLRVMAMVTAMMTAAFILMPFSIIGTIAMAIAWTIHVLYFIFGIKTA